jgi:DNA-binding response OmpR family regulator
MQRDEDPAMSPPAPIRVLVVEDEILQKHLLDAVLRKELPDADIVHAGFLAEAVARVCEEPFDLILLDLWLPDATGFDALERLVALTDARIVVRAGRMNGALQAVGREHGAFEVVDKSAFPREVLDAVRRALTGPADLARPVDAAADGRVAVVAHVA